MTWEQPEFGRWLRAWRHGRRLTQRQLADELGYDITYIVKLEGGTRPPTAPLLARLAQVSGQDPPPPRRGPSAALPAPLGQLVGRDEQIAALLAELEEGARFVTLVGPPGIGKTSLAMELGRAAEHRLQARVGWVPLREVSDPGGVAPEVHRRLGLTPAADTDPVDAIRAHLRAHHPSLLLLDNFEHVLAAAPLVRRLLDGVPGLTVVVTSREPLGLEGERVRTVPPLVLPEPAPVQSLATISASPAVTLFVARARMARGDFALTEANGADIADACRRLDGIPLAIVLAAGAMRTTNAAHVAAGVGLRAARNGSASLTDHERTLDEAIMSSWTLLDPDGRAMFTGLAVCAGGATLPAAAALAGIADSFDALDVLDCLVRKSLVEARPDAAGGPRYELLETMRAFASDRLVETGRAEAVRDRHLDHFVAASVELGAALTGKDQVWALASLAADHANLAAAFERAAARCPAGALRLAASLWRYFLIQDIPTGRRWLDRALAACDDPSADRAVALIGAGALAWVTGAFAASATFLGDGLALATTLGRRDLAALAWLNRGALADQLGLLDEAGQAFAHALATCDGGDNRTRGTALMGQGVVARRRSDHDTACGLWIEAARLFADAGDVFNQALALGNLSLSAEETGNLDEAQEFRAECRRIQAAVGDTRGMAITTASLARIAARRGDLQMARTNHLDALDGFRELGDLRRAASSLLHLADLAGRAGNHHRAARLAGAADAVLERLGIDGDDDGPLRDDVVARATDVLGAAGAARALAAGRGLSVEAAAALAGDR